MKIRLALAGLAYVAAFAVGALLVTGTVKVGPFGGSPDTALALDSADNGSSTLLCYGCYNYNQVYTVRVTVTFQPSHNYCNWNCGYNWNTCNWGCGNYHVNTWNACNWGCGGYNWNTCNWGCGYNTYHQPVVYQPVVYHQPVKFHHHCGCWY